MIITPVILLFLFFTLTHGISQKSGMSILYCEVKSSSLYLRPPPCVETWVDIQNRREKVPPNATNYWILTQAGLGRGWCWLMVTLITKCGNMVQVPAACSHSCRYEVEEFETLAHNLQFAEQNYLSGEMASQLGNYGKEWKFSPIVNSRYHFLVKLLYVLIQIISAYRIPDKTKLEVELNFIFESSSGNIQDTNIFI